jgi:hypothetical protein
MYVFIDTVGAGEAGGKRVGVCQVDLAAASEVLYLPMPKGKEASYSQC